MAAVTRKFVTATLFGAKDTRQGVKVYEHPNFIVVVGESESVYKCEKDYQQVPFDNLYGTAKEFAIKLGVKE